MKELINIEMSQFTSFKAGGKARRLLVVDTPEELGEALCAFQKSGDDYLILGNGTNTLFAAELYDGTVIKLGEGFDYVEIGGEESEDGYSVKAGASTLLSRLSKKVAAEELTGLEFAAGIPGSVGGAAFMNAGAYDGEIKDTLKQVKVISLSNDLEEGYEINTICKEDLDLSYRHSKLMETGDIIIEAEFCLKKGDRDEINGKMKDFAERRSSKQPLEYPSAGSFFKRPPGSFAGKLIEDSGLKGFSVGGAQVSEKHAGFIINTGGATPEDILNLMNHVQEVVKENYGVDLEPEVRIIK